MAAFKVMKLEDAETRKALGGTIRMVFTPDTAETKNFRFVVGDFSPGEGLSSHLHPESEEVYFVIRGTVYLGRERRELPVEPEMALYIPAGTVHGVANTGEENLVIAFFVAPGKEPSKVIEG